MHKNADSKVLVLSTGTEGQSQQGVTSRWSSSTHGDAERMSNDHSSCWVAG